MTGKFTSLVAACLIFLSPAYVHSQQDNVHRKDPATKTHKVQMGTISKIRKVIIARKTGSNRSDTLRPSLNKNTDNALELTVRMDTGKSYAIVQKVDNRYRIGDRVRVLERADGTMKVKL